MKHTYVTKYKCKRIIKNNLENGYLLEKVDAKGKIGDEWISQSILKKLYSWKAETHGRMRNLFNETCGSIVNIVISYQGSLIGLRENL